MTKYYSATAYIESEELNQVMDAEGQIGLKADYELKSKKGAATWYTTNEEYRKGNGGGFFKIWARDGWESIGSQEMFRAERAHRIIWTGQYA